MDDTPHAVRDLVRRLDRAALATVLPTGANGADKTGTDAWPYASLVLVAVDHDLSPILLLSDLAEHSKAIAADPRVSLLFDGTAGLDQPLTGARVSLLGRAAATDDERLKRRFLARHPDAAMYAGFKDFRFYRVSLERAHLVAGFGKIRWLAAHELLPLAPLADLLQAEAGIVAHMNDDHADAVQLYAGKLLGLPGGNWRMTGIDAEGIDLRQAGQVARLPFDAPLAAADEARQTLVALVARARAG
jgi:heme iron utilization protein